MKRRTINFRRLVPVGACLGLVLATGALASDEPPASGTPDAKPAINVRKLFAMNCSWCHDGYGMHAGKGPKLAGTSLSPEEVYYRIEKGKSGAMPGFGKVLSKEQIDAFVEYIKSLPNE